MPRTIKPTEAHTEIPAPTKLLTDKQVMEMLGISRTGLHYLMRQQGFPYIKFGATRCAALRFNAQSVAQWLAQNERHPVGTGEAQVHSKPAGLHLS